jgi:hypothetical protein
MAGSQPFGCDMPERAATVALLDQNRHPLGRLIHDVTRDAIPGLPGFGDARNPENRLPGFKVLGSHGVRL